MKTRVRNVFNNLEKKPDIIIIKNSSEPYIDDNFFYVTGLYEGLFEGSLAFLYSDGSVDLCVSELEAESAKKANVALHIYNSKEEYEQIISGLIKSYDKIGLNYNGISYNAFCKMKDFFEKKDFIDVSGGFAKARLLKDDIEIKLIKKACDIADMVMSEIPQVLSENMYEYEVAAEINFLLQKKGADRPAFNTISSFGKNSAEPHYSHGKNKLKINDFSLFDFGARYKRYNSDITRTFVFGKSNKLQKNMYETVLEAQKIGFEAIKTGVKANEVHESVKKYIDSTQFKDRFIHSTGHSIGLAVHDGGAGFSSDSDIELRENMVFTVEPGVYMPGFGGVRIEDDIIVRKDGIELLTKSSRELIEI
jgi:Xaa-Pro dipeptidase